MSRGVFYAEQNHAIFRIGYAEDILMPLNEKGHYQPLPRSITIRSSPISGLGLFAVEEIGEGTILGVTHVWTNDCGGYWIRTPLGGFYNHNPSNPNCESIERDGKKFLRARRVIRPCEELTARYTLYDPTKS